jgi:hypothetical protein
MHLSSIITLLLVSFASAKDLTKKERKNIRSASHAFEMSAEEVHELMEERKSSSSKPAKKLSSSIETGTDSLCYDNPQGWYSSGGTKYTCEWFERNNGCAAWGHKYENFGKTANEACCACGGGGADGDYGDTCVDFLWKDELGDSCDWYAEGNNCAVHGRFWPNWGKTANVACCVCGGGMSTKLISAKVKEVDNNDPTCKDTRGWKDSLGYGCSFYAQGDNCEKYGSSYKHWSKTANDACCVCGGGSLNEHFVAEVKEAILMTKEERDEHSKTKTH